MDNKAQYIRKKAKSAKINNGFTVNGVKVQIGEEPNFDVEKFLKNKFNKLPNNLVNSVNKIIFGDFYLSPEYVGRAANDIIYLQKITIRYLVMVNLKKNFCQREINYITR